MRRSASYRMSLTALSATLLTVVCALTGLAQNSPVPFLNQPLVPDAVAPGGPDFTLTVNGTGFVQGATVNLNGSPLVSTFVSGSQVTTTVPASDILAAGTASVTVTNPGTEASNVGFLSVTSSGSVAAFLTTDYPVPTAFQQMVSGDFNGDGKLDLAATTLNGISIFLGNGDGTFQAPINYTYGAGQGPFAILTGDFNGDGKLDLAFTLTLSSSDVAISLGNGDGTFQPPAEFPAGTLPYIGAALAAGDFNGDGKLDLAVADFQGLQVSVLLGNGDGTLGAATQFAVPGDPQDVAIGDFNRDGKLDLAVTSNLAKSSGVYVLLGNGDGTFQPAVGYQTAVAAYQVTVADFNSDGKLDLAAASSNSNSISVLLGNGDGTFQSQVKYPVGLSPSSISAADFNGDGKVDLVVGNEFSNSVSVLLGNGDGTFQKQNQFATGTLPNGMVVGDLSNDGRLDIGTQNSLASTISVLLQTQEPLASLSATSLAFGDEGLGTISATQIVTLTNIGGADLAISSIAVNDTDFLENNNCPASLLPLARCAVSVAFKPGSSGPHSGAVTITDNASGSPQTISLSGTGTFIGLAPSSLNFGTVKIGQSSAPQTVTVTNVATHAVNIQNIRTSSREYPETNTCPSSLAAKASCTITVTFSPNSGGTQTAVLGVYDNGVGSPQTVSLTGIGD